MRNSPKDSKNSGHCNNLATTTYRPPQKDETEDKKDAEENVTEFLPTQKP